MRRAAAWMAALFVLTLAAAASASAATYTPTTFADEDGATTDCPADGSAAGCSLREAVRAANDAPAADEIVLTAGTYGLDPEQGPLIVDDNRNVVIRGAGA